VKVKPMLGEYEVPGIQRVGTLEARELVEIRVPGLEGSYHQDLGSRPVTIVIEGTLAGDDPRDDFLNAVRVALSGGDPVDFVADIVTATAVEKVHVADLRVAEVAGVPDSFRYTLALTQHTDPPPQPDAGLDAVGDAIDAEAGSLFDALQVPDLVGALPALSDPTPPLRGVLDGVTGALGPVGDAAGALTSLFGS
jgi:hypothetical protein